MKVFVTGASGFIGGAFVRTLCAAGHAVTALVRRPAPGLPPGVVAVHGDLAAADGLDAAASALEQADAVVHLAALRKAWGLPPAVVQRVNVASGAALIERARRAQRFVFVSSIGVHGHARGAPLDETSPLAPYDAYGASKVAAEGAVRAAAAASGRPLTIVRPGIVYGPGDTYGMVTNMAKLIATRRYLRVGGGYNRVQVLHVDDLARALLAATTAPAAAGEAVIVAGHQDVTLRALADLLAAALGGRVPRLGVPTPALRLAAVLFETAGRLRGARREPFVTRSKVTLLTSDYICRTDKARAVLRFAPAIDIRQGIEQTVAWLRRARAFD